MSPCLASLWTPDRITREAARIDPATAQLIETIMHLKPHSEQGFRAGLGILRRARSYGTLRLEAACLRGLSIGARSYGSIASILKNALDKAFDDQGHQPDAAALPFEDRLALLIDREVVERRTRASPRG